MTSVPMPGPDTVKAATKEYVFGSCVHIHIENIDVNKNSTILFQYVNGTTDLITFSGNCGLTFTNWANGNTSEKLLEGNHTRTISRLMTLRSPISVVCHNIKGRNTWSFASASIVSKVTITDNSDDWSGLNNIRIKEYTMPTGLNLATS
jgi:hypothetical protein